MIFKALTSRLSLVSLCRPVLCLVAAAGVLGGIVAAPAPAAADPKPWIWSWGSEHWRDQDFVPYIDHPRQTHNNQWDKSNWRPEHWAEQRGGNPVKVMDGLYRADIVRDQYMRDDIPVLKVGPGFYMLGGEDKRRVTHFIDRVYGITGDHLYGMYMLYDWRTNKPIGTYTQYGLALH